MVTVMTLIPGGFGAISNTRPTLVGTSNLTHLKGLLQFSAGQRSRKNEDAAQKTELKSINNEESKGARTIFLCSRSHRTLQILNPQFAFV
jgi:hypothetical protein